MNKGLVSAEEETGLIIPPDQVVQRGKASAVELTKIVSSRAKQLVLSGKTYLFFEDWQTLGRFYGVTAKVVSTQEIREGETLIGFLASAVALSNGLEISGADAECTFDEQNWTGKPRYQLRSMAQTRACSKALRNCLGWVAVLAGYEATPAEEVDRSIPAAPDSKVVIGPKVTESQLKKIWAVSKEKGYEPPLATAIMIKLYNTGASKELTKKQASDFIKLLDEGKYLGMSSKDVQEEEPVSEVESEDLPSY